MSQYRLWRNFVVLTNIITTTTITKCHILIHTSHVSTFSRIGKFNAYFASYAIINLFERTTEPMNRHFLMW